MNFPRPATAFEHLMAVERSAMICTLRLELEGTLRRADFEAAVEAARAHHPLLRARIVWRDGRPWWEEAPGSVVFQTGQSLIVARWHHACCDGRGFLRFMTDVLVEYDRRLGGTASRPVVRAPGPPDRPLPPSGARGGVVDAVRRLLRIHARLAPGRGSTSGPILVSHSFSAETSAALSRAAGAAGTSANDLLARDLILALRAWNGARNAGTSRLALAVPMSLWSGGWEACNEVSLAVLEWDAESGEAPDEILREVARQMARRKADRAVRFTRVLERLHRRPWLMRLFPRRPILYATAVITNWGRPSFLRGGGRFGNVTVRRCHGFTPVRAGTRASLAVVRRADGLDLGLTCDGSCFDEADARALLDLYVAQVEASAASVKSSPT